MQPISFPEQNCVFAKDQKEYLPLPVHKTAEGLVVSCWRLSVWERLRLLFSGRLWLQVLSFNQPLQPQFLGIEYPFSEATK